MLNRVELNFREVKTTYIFSKFIQVLKGSYYQSTIKHLQIYFQYTNRERNFFRIENNRGVYRRLFIGSRENLIQTLSL